MSSSPLTFNAWLRWDVIRRRLERWVEIETFLEVGCGMGALGARLARSYQYVGYDPDPESARVAHDRVHPRGRIVCDRLPERPEWTFDALGAFEVIEHFADDERALRRWRRWLRPGGRLLVSVPGRPEHFGPADRWVGHRRRYDASTLRDVVEGAGYKEMEILYYGFPLGYVLEWGRDLLAPGADRSRSEGTAESGRFLQPPAFLGWASAAATFPFRLAQRPFERSGPGTGLIALARNPR